MKDFNGKIAVITGAGTGMGRELAKQLASEGCHVAFCDVMAENMNETKAACEEIAQEGTRISAHECDVSDEPQVVAFREAVKAAHDTDQINLLFNNAGVGGGGSMLLDSRDEWDRVFGICWGGVYHCTRAFLPLLVASDDGYIVNTSSVNGFWACLSPNVEHTAYSAAKFAVKGFTEALITDLRNNAPHVKAAVVMPGHIGTSIAINSRLIHGRDPETATPEELERIKILMSRFGFPTEGLSDVQVLTMMKVWSEEFRDNAPVSGTEAATIILDAVREEKWRVLVGDDAKALDERVRADPETVYDATFQNPLRLS